jgi:hypothetical protein
VKILLHLLLLGGGFDDEVAGRQAVERVRGGDALERRRLVLFREALAAHLARHVAVDGGERRLHAIG